MRIQVLTGGTRFSVSLNAHHLLNDKVPMSSSSYYSAMRSEESGLLYQCNRDVNISETAMKDVLVTSAKGFENYQKIELLKHDNLLEIAEVFREENQVCVLYRSLPHGVYFCPLSEAFNKSEVKNMVRQERTETEEFIQFIMDLFNGLQKLHLNGFYHGNLSLETTYMYFGTNSRRPVFMLSRYRFVDGKALKEMIVKDYRDFAGMIRTLVEKLAVASWLNDVRFVEVKEFYRSLDVGFANMFVDVQQMIHYYKIFITGHPILLVEEDRPEYILEAVTYIRKHNIKFNYMDAVFKKNPLYSNILGNWLKNRKKPFVSVSEKDDPGKFLTDMVRNFLGHKKDNENNRILTAIIGRTRIKIDQYFREYQPRIVIALFNGVIDAGFKFQGFKV